MRRGLVTFHVGAIYVGKSITGQRTWRVGLLTETVVVKRYVKSGTTVGVLDAGYRSFPPREIPRVTR